MSDFFQTAATQTLQLLSLLLMGYALVSWLFRLFLAARTGDLRRALPLLPGSAHRPTRKALLCWALALLLLRLLQYALGYLLLCRQAGQWLPLEPAVETFWKQWDAYHYLNLSAQGYVNTGNERLMLVFFPLYPFLIAVLSATGLSALWSALLISLCASLGCVLALQWIVCPLYGRRAAHLACAYLLLNPLSIFMAAPYPEALFLCLTLLAMLAAQRRRYALAGLLGALSAFARMLGLVVLGVLLLEGFIQALREKGKHWYTSRALWASLGGALIVPLGFLGYLALNVIISGAPFTFLEYQASNWGQTFGSFWRSLGTTVEMLFSHNDLEDLLGTWLPQVIAIPWVMALLALRGRRLSLPHAAYSWVYLFLALAPTWLLSGPRYIMAMATLPILQANATSSKKLHILSLSIQAVLLLFVLYAYGIRRMIL